MRTLTLLDPYARFTRGDDYPYGPPVEVIDAIRDAARSPGSAEVDQLAQVAPTMVDDPKFRAWWDRVGRRSASPLVASRLIGVVTGADIRPVLPDVVAPTLVFLRGAVPSYDPGHGRHVVGHLRDVEVVESDATDDLWWIGDDGFLDHLDRFTRAR